jgi:hypothetical protein
MALFGASHDVFFNFSSTAFSEHGGATPLIERARVSRNDASTEQSKKVQSLPFKAKALRSTGASLGTLRETMVRRVDCRNGEQDIPCADDAIPKGSISLVAAFWRLLGLIEGERLERVLRAGGSDPEALVERRQIPDDARSDWELLLETVNDNGHLERQSPARVIRNTEC